MGTARSVLVLVAAVLIITGCGGDQSAVSVTPSATVGTLSAHTGVPDVDTIIDAVLRDDVAVLRGLIRFTPKPCTFHSEQLERPFCRPSEAEGTSVDSLPQVITGSCRIAVRMIQERADEIAADGTPFADVRLYAVYRVASSSNDAYTGVFVRDVDDPDFTALGAIFHIEAGRIVGVDQHCGHTAAEMVQGVAAEDFLVRPTAQ